MTPNDEYVKLMTGEIMGTETLEGNLSLSDYIHCGS